MTNQKMYHQLRKTYLDHSLTMDQSAQKDFSDLLVLIEHDIIQEISSIPSVRKRQVLAAKVLRSMKNDLTLNKYVVIKGYQYFTNRVIAFKLKNHLRLANALDTSSCFPDLDKFFTEKPIYRELFKYNQIEMDELKAVNKSHSKHIWKYSDDYEWWSEPEKILLVLKILGYGKGDVIEAIHTKNHVIIKKGDDYGLFCKMRLDKTTCLDSRD